MDNMMDRVDQVWLKAAAAPAAPGLESVDLPQALPEPAGEHEPGNPSEGISQMLELLLILAGCPDRGLPSGWRTELVELCALEGGRVLLSVKGVLSALLTRLLLSAGELRAALESFYGCEN